MAVQPQCHTGWKWRTENPLAQRCSNPGLSGPYRVAMPSRLLRSTYYRHQLIGCHNTDREFGSERAGPLNIVQSTVMIHSVYTDTWTVPLKPSQSNRHEGTLVFTC